MHRQLFLEGVRFVPERALLRRLLAPGMTVVDVGSNIGYYALLEAQIVGSAGRILAIEPEPDNLRELERNLRANTIDNARVLPIALGSFDGRGSLSLGVNGRLAADGNAGIGIEVRRLDSVLEGAADFIKIDVEGFEGEVLAGAEETLRRQRPSLLVEVHPALLPPPTSVRSIFERLRDYPFTGVFIAAPETPSFSKILTRYTPGGAIRRVADVAGWIRRCEEGQVVEPFWVVCSRHLELASSGPGSRGAF